MAAKRVIINMAGCNLWLGLPCIVHQSDAKSRGTSSIALSSWAAVGALNRRVGFSFNSFSRALCEKLESESLCASPTPCRLSRTAYSCSCIFSLAHVCAVCTCAKIPALAICLGLGGGI